MTTSFKVWDLVRVKQDACRATSPRSIHFAPEMERYKGLALKIVFIGERYIRLDTHDEVGWVWDYNWLEPVEGDAVKPLKRAPRKAAEPAVAPEVPKEPPRTPCVVESTTYATKTGNKKDVLLQVYQKGKKHGIGSLNIILTHGLFQCCGFGGIEGFSNGWNPHMMNVDEFANMVYALHRQKTVAAKAGWSYGEPGRRNYILTQQQVQHNIFHKFLVQVCGAKVVQEFHNHYDSGHHLTMFTVDTFEAMAVFWQCEDKRYYGESSFKKLPVDKMDADGKLKAFLASVPVPKQYD